MTATVRDAFGLPLTLADAASEGAADDFVAGFVACEARAANVLEAAADDDSVFVQAAAAAVHLFAESGDAAANARPFVERALASKVPASGRERRFARIVAAWAADDLALALRLLDEQLAAHPRDLLALKLAHYLLFNLGDSPAMLRLALGSQDAAGDVAQLHGMTAFAWEQCHRLREAEAAARRALAMRADEPWAHHALAHVMLTEGRIEEGRRFLDGVAAGWVGLNSFMQTHNWWHQALFLLEQDEGAAALALYDEQVWGVCKEYTQDQAGAVSLLARLELAEVDVGERWRDVAGYLAARTCDQAQPFLDLHYAYGLARAGRSEADALLANVEAYARSGRAPALTRDVWRRVAAPACRGLIAHARGDWGTAVEALGAALPRLAEVGGSHAQRDLFGQIHVDALTRSGRLAAAQQALESQARTLPESRRLRRRLAPVYRALGLPQLT